MFNIITSSPVNNYLYNNNKCVYYSVLPICFLIAGLASFILTLYNLPRALFYIMRDKEYNNIFFQICDFILHIFVGFCCLYYMYFTGLMSSF